MISCTQEVNSSILHVRSICDALETYLIVPAAAASLLPPPLPPLLLLVIITAAASLFCSSLGKYCPFYRRCLLWFLLPHLDRILPHGSQPIGDCVADAAVRGRSFLGLRGYSHQDPQGIPSQGTQPRPSHSEDLGPIQERGAGGRQHLSVRAMRNSTRSHSRHTKITSRESRVRPAVMVGNIVHV